MNIFKSAAAYEDWLRRHLDGVVEKDIAVKHRKMADSAFQFLRATYWRWGETIYGICRDLKDAPHVLAVGDVHVENFGTWRDAEGRLVWGVNDFDEAAKMPYVLDIVRLAASAVLAKVPGITPTDICASVAEGYAKGLKAPAPFVLDEDHKWLRDIVVVRDKDRKKFWAKFDPARIAEKKPEKVDPVAPEELRGRYRKAIDRARPDSGIELQFYSREAGTGSLGRPRFFGVGPWQGALIVREAKAMVRSGWTLTHGGAHRLRCAEIATGSYRCPDPTYHLRGHVHGAAAVAERLQDRGRAAEEDVRQEGREGQCAAGAATDQRQDVECDGPRTRIDPPRHTGEGRHRGGFFGARGRMAARIRDGGRGGHHGRTAGVEEISGKVAASAEELMGLINNLHCRGGSG